MTLLYDHPTLKKQINILLDFKKQLATHSEIGPYIGFIYQWDVPYKKKSVVITFIPNTPTNVCFTIKPLLALLQKSSISINFFRSKNHLLCRVPLIS